MLTRHRGQQREPLHRPPDRNGLAGVGASSGGAGPSWHRRAPRCPAGSRGSCWGEDARAPSASDASRSSQPPSRNASSRRLDRFWVVWDCRFPGRLGFSGSWVRGFADGLPACAAAAVHGLTKHTDPAGRLSRLKEVEHALGGVAAVFGSVYRRCAESAVTTGVSRHVMLRRVIPFIITLGVVALGVVAVADGFSTQTAQRDSQFAVSGRFPAIEGRWRSRIRRHPHRTLPMRHGGIPVAWFLVRGR